jgi:hypothetical protein
MYVKQGSINCETANPTWSGPDSGSKYYYRDPTGCTTTFDTRKQVKMWIYSSGSNDVYIDEMGVRVGDTWKSWYSSGSYVQIDHDENNGYYTSTS